MNTFPSLILSHPQGPSGSGYKQGQALGPSPVWTEATLSQAWPAQAECDRSCLAPTSPWVVRQAG